MPKPRLQYDSVELWTHELIERAVVENDPDVLLRVVIGVSMHEENQQYAEALCIRLSSHPHFNVRGNAILGFGHIARVHGKLNREVVYPIIERGLSDPHEYVRGQAQGAKEDTEHFLKWEFKNET